MTIPSIETSYSGYRFRSRLEARWAVFFDALKMTWHYEPQGYEVAGTPYLPDFYVDQLGWVEVKGELDRAGLLKLALAAGADGLPWTLRESTEQPAATFADEISWADLANPIVPRISVLGDIPDPAGDRAWCHPQIGLSQGRHIVRRQAVLMPYSRGVRWVGAWDWGGLPADAPPEMPHGAAALLPINPFHRITEAYRAARSARFEHGESGAPTEKPTEKGAAPRPTQFPRGIASHREWIDQVCGRFNLGTVDGRVEVLRRAIPLVGGAPVEDQAGLMEHLSATLSMPAEVITRALDGYTRAASP